MAKTIAKWLLESYARLWQAKKNEEFDFDSALIILKGQAKNKNTLSKILTELAKAGWLMIDLDKNNFRKRVCRLKDPTEVMGSIKPGSKES